MPFSLRNHFDPFDLFAGTLISWINLIRFLRSGQVFMAAL